MLWSPSLPLHLCGKPLVIQVNSGHLKSSSAWYASPSVNNYYIMCISMVIFACLPYCCLCGPTHVVQRGSADLKLLTCDCRYQQQRQQQLQSGRQMPPLPAFLRNLTAQQPTASSSYPAQHAANSVLSGSPAQYLQSRQPQAAANTAPHPVMSGEHGVQCNMDLHMSIPLFYKTVM